MQAQIPQQTSTVDVRLGAPPPLFTVEQLAKRNPAFTQSSIRNLIFKAEPRQSTKGKISGNGLIECRAIIRLGRKVLIHEARFFAWIEASQHGSQP